jgi:hypothetical protein
MANAPQIYNVQFTRSQLELVEKMLSQEIAHLESGYAHPHPQILKRAFDAVYVHLLPSPELKQKRFDKWVRKISSSTAIVRSRVGRAAALQTGGQHDFG